MQYSFKIEIEGSMPIVFLRLSTCGTPLVFEGIEKKHDQGISKGEVVVD